MEEKIEIEYVDPLSLSPAEFNPRSRTEDASLKKLKLSMKEDGFWPYMPIVATKDRVIIDGHRRWTTAKILGISLVPCVFVDADLKKTWGDLHYGTRVISQGEIVKALYRGLRVVPKEVRQRLSAMTSMVGDDAISILAEKGLSMNLYRYTSNIVWYCGLKGDKEFSRKVFLWLVNHRPGYRLIRSAMEMDVDPLEIISAIEDDKELVFG